MKLIENYIIYEDGNIFYNGKLLSANKRRELACETSNSEILEILSQDEYWFVRWAVVENSSTPTNTIKKLLQDIDYYVRYQAILITKTLLKEVENDK